MATQSILNEVNAGLAELAGVRRTVARQTVKPRPPGKIVRVPASVKQMMIGKVDQGNGIFQLQFL
jgi:hypothetical protein